MKPPSIFRSFRSIRQGHGIRLRVLGGVVLERDGAAVTGPPGQRHQLALLAFLAAVPGQSASREKLTGYLWPELDETRARHRLSVALHVLRRGLGAECIVTSGDSVALNPAVIWTDVGAFHAATAEGRLDEAAELYAGAFADGFSLSGALEFGHWVDAERTRLARVYRTALEQLIAQETEAGNLTAAARWWKRLAEAEPYSAPVAMGLVRALAAIDDPGAALRAARAHASMVEGHLDVPANPEVLALANQLVRNDTAGSDPRSARPASGESGPSMAGEAAASASATRTPAHHGARTGADDRPVSGRQLLLAGMAIASFTVIASLRAGWRDSADTPATVTVVSFTPADPSVRAAWGHALAERIARNLAYIPGIGVTTMAPVPSRNQASVVRNVASAGDAAAVVDGRFERREGRVLVTARLLEPRSGEARWSAGFEVGGALDSSRIDKLAFMIADSLRLRIAPFEPHHYTSNARAYDKFLEGVFSQRRFTRRDTWAALQLYREAYEEDTTFALAHAISGNAYIALAGFGVRPDVAFREARHHLVRALELDSMLPEGHAAMGFLQVWGDRDFAAGERSLIRAIMLYPTAPEARAWFGWYALHVRGWDDVAMANIRKALELDPVNAARSHFVEWGLHDSGRFEEVFAQHQVTWSIDAEVARSLTDSPLAASYRQMGRYEEAIAEYEALRERTGAGADGLAITYARMGRAEDARAMLQDIEARAEESPGLMLNVARIYANLGEVDRAFAWMERAEAVRPDRMLGINADPALAPLRDDPRFDEWLRRIGLAPR